MKYRIAVVASLVTGVLAGCSILPTGNSSRAKPMANVEDLFISDAVVGSTAADAEKNRQMAVASTGLTVRKSKRGNMESYVVRGQRYHTLGNSDGYSARGLASWYGPNFHGRTASNGEVYDMYKMTAAHKTLPLPTYARVTHLDSGKSVVVKINDRGPFSGDRIIDMSFAAALQLGMVNDGTAMVEIQALSAEELAVMSGPKNTMGIDFDYLKDGVATPVADSELAQVVGQGKAESESLAIPTVAEGTALEIPALTDAGAAGESVPVIAADAVVPVVTARAEQVEVPANDSGVAVDLAAAADTDAPAAMFPAEKVAVVDASASEEVSLPVALVDASSVGQAVPVTGAAMQSAQASNDSKASGVGYYIQAGVYVDVEDAERLAVDIVLTIPREEVHVKPLKGSEMYRVTVGPIIKNDHAKTVSAKLDEAGIENYTVKVKEI